MAQQQLLKQEPSVSQILRTYKKQLTQNIERHTDGSNISTMSQQLNQESSISQILRTYGKQFRQIRKQYADGLGEDVLWVSLCHIMVGMANASLPQKEDYMLH